MASIDPHAPEKKNPQAHKPSGIGVPVLFLSFHRDVVERAMVRSLKTVCINSVEPREIALF